MFVGGAFGTLLRAGLAEGVPRGVGEWPVATLIANLAGAFVIGFVVGWLASSPGADPRWRPLLTTGLCGGLTTFATLQVELVLLVDEGAGGVAAGYLAVSLVAGLALVLAGRSIALAVVRRSGAGR